MRQPLQNIAIGDVFYCPMMGTRMTVEKVNENGTLNMVWFTGTELKRAELIQEHLVPDVGESRQILSD